MQLNKIGNVKIYQKRVNSLDDIFTSSRITKCDLLKVDCEGCEYEIFRNTSDSTLKKIQNIAMEIHLFNENQKRNYRLLKSKLKSGGFTLVEKPCPVHKYLRLLYAYKNEK